MVNKLRQLGRNFNPFISLLVVIELLIFATNYTQGTYLIGWDNIMPEFNLSLNFTRNLVSLWQDYRGLGTLDGLAHSANLMHTTVIAILSLILPQSILRYVFIYGMHALGGIGMFLLLRYLLNSKFEASSSTIETTSYESNIKQVSDFKFQISSLVNVSAFVGALFYMLNIGTIQMFYAPLEVFATHFAALPFITWMVYKVFEKPNTRQFFYLFLSLLLLSPQGFVPTVFIVFLMLVGSILIVQILKTRQVRASGLILLTVLLANAFWLVPYTYSAFHTPRVIQETKINQIASQEIYYRNKAHGGILDVLQLKGFMLTTDEYDTRNQKDVYFMQPWLTHTTSPVYMFFYVFFLVCTLVGIYVTVKKRQILALPFFLTFAGCLLFLANNTPLLEQFNTWFRSALPIFGEAFRIPFTKFITVFIFCFTILMSYGLFYLSTRVRRARFIPPGLGILFLIYLSYPVFQGYFTSPLLRLELPQGYLPTFSYFRQKDPTARIAILPHYSFWNWQYRTWNHRGSGFLWYGLPQPILERAFDPWSLENEQYYTELTSAIQQADPVTVNQVLHKYAIQYVLVDTTLINTLSRQPIEYNQLESFLLQSVKLRKEASYGSLAIFSVPDATTEVTTLPLSSVITTGSETLRGRAIILDTQAGAFITGSEPELQPVFPALSTEKLQDDISFFLSEDDFVTTLTETYAHPFIKPPQLIIPSLFTSEYLVPVAVQKQTGKLVITPLLPLLRVNGEPITVQATPQTFTLKTISNPISLTFTDTKHVFTNTNEVMWTYLLNNQVNTVTLSDGSREEILLIDPSTFPREEQTIQLPTNRIDNIDVIIQKIASPFTHTDLIKRGVYQVKQLPSSLPTFFSPQDAVITKSAEQVSFSLQQGKADLSFYLDNLPHQGSYLTLVSASSEAGLPINFYLDNTYQKRAEFETVLSEKARRNILILPKTEPYFKGYGFHFTMKSLGNEQVSARIQDIDVYPFPQETLMRMMLTTVNPSERIAIRATSSPFTRNTLSSFTTRQVPANSLLTLHQAYDPGWKAYELENSEWKMTNSMKAGLPFLFGNELKTHTKVNNWANGWIIDAGKKQVIMIYLPQYLQYIGQLMTFGSLLFLLIRQLKLRGKK